MPSEIVDSGRDFVSELDEKIFGKNTLSTKLFKYFLTMAILMLLLPPTFDILFETLNVDTIFYYISLPSLVTITLLFFVFFTLIEIFRPIKGLLEDVRKLQQGMLDVNLNVGGYVEIESLAKSVDRMRNSLFIATSYLGKRDEKKDSIWKVEISNVSLYTIFLLPFLIYAITLTMLAAVLYSDVLYGIMESIPGWHIWRGVIMVVYGVVMAFSLGYLLSKAIGAPMRKLARAAEEASRGNMNADFTVKRNLGYISELSIRLNDLKEAIKRAMEEMEGEE